MTGLVTCSWVPTVFLCAWILCCSDVQAENGPEVDVVGCVVDFRGQPYRGADVELSGLNYKGGAHYAGNNSVGVTDERGEFRVRMKAGVPEQAEVPDHQGAPEQKYVPARPATARVLAKVGPLYARKGWMGGGTPVWPEVQVSNSGERMVDLRPRGCLQINYPIDVSGEVLAEENLEYTNGIDQVTLQLKDAHGYAIEFGAFVPTKTNQIEKFDANVDFYLGEQFSVEIYKNPLNVDCRMTVSKGKAGFSGEIRLGTGSTNHNFWSTDYVRVRCDQDDKTKAFIRARDEKKAILQELGEQMVEENGFELRWEIPGRNIGRAAYLQACDDKIAAARAKMDKADGAKIQAEEPVVELPRRGGSSGGALFQQAAASDEQYKKDKLKRGQELTDVLTTDTSASDMEAGVANLLKIVDDSLKKEAARKEALAMERERERQRQLAIQQEQLRIAQEQQHRTYQAEAARAEAFNRESAKAASREAENQRIYKETSERRVAETIRQNNEQEARKVQQRQADQARIEAMRKEMAERDRYYAPLSCASMSSRRYQGSDRTYACLQNNCGRPIEAHSKNAMWTVGVGSCLSGTWFAACEKNDGFDQSRKQCRR